MTGYELLARRILDAVSEVGESAVITVVGAAEAHAAIVRILIEALGPEIEKRRAIERVLLNYLGTADPQEVTAWILAAWRGVADSDPISRDGSPIDDSERVTTIADIDRQCKLVYPGERRVTPFDFSDGALRDAGFTEQDVIALQRDYTRKVEDRALPFGLTGAHPDSTGSC